MNPSGRNRHIEAAIGMPQMKPPDAQALYAWRAVGERLAGGDARIMAVECPSHRAHSGGKTHGRAPMPRSAVTALASVIHRI
jgi:hypothetical protein